MQSSNLKISVAIPTYNAEAHIEACLRSVKEQEGVDLDQVEILIVDDCSTDNSWDLIQRSGVRSLQNKTNLGLTGNWNMAVESASAPIILQLHQDDQLKPGTLKAAIEIFEDRSVALVAFSQMNGVPKPWKDCRSFTGSEYFYYLLNFNECPPPSCTFFRRELVKNFTFYDSAYSYCPEFDLYLRLAKDNPESRFVLDERPLILRGTSESQFSKNNFHLGLIDKIHLYHEYEGMLSSKERERSSSALTKTIDRGIGLLLHQKRWRQVRSMFKDPGSRKWLLRNFLKLHLAIRTGLSRTIKR